MYSLLEDLHQFSICRKGFFNTVICLTLSNVCRPQTTIKMEVITENSGLLSNLEVYMLLKDIRAGQVNKQKLHKSQHNLATITYETVKYLERSQCGQQTPENVASFMDAMKNFNLTKAEKLQLLNHRPTSAVEIQLMIEESEERLTEEQIYQLLSVIAASLPGPEPEQPPVMQEADGETMESCDNEYEAI